MKKTNKMLAGLVVGTMAFAGLAAVKIDNPNLSTRIQNVAYADVNANKVKLVNSTFNSANNTNTLEFSGLSLENLGPVYEFMVISRVNGGTNKVKLGADKYSIEDLDGKMVLTFPGKNVKNVNLVFKNTYLGLHFKPNQGGKFALDHVQVLNLEEFRNNAKVMLFDTIDRNLFNQKQLYYIDKIYARGDSILAITEDYKSIVGMFQGIAQKINQMRLSRNYTEDQMADKTQIFLEEGLEKILSVKPKIQGPQKQVAKKASPKKNDKKAQNTTEKLREAINKNKIVTRAAKLLLDTVPNLSKDLKTKLNTLMKESEDLLAKAEKMLEELEANKAAR